MTTIQTLQAAGNGTTWSRRVDGVTYFLRKINNTYEVWTSLNSSVRSTITIGQAVTYYDQYNLGTPNPAAASPPPTQRPAQPPPAPRPAPARTPEPVPATTPALGATGIRDIAPQLQAAAAPQQPTANTPAPSTGVNAPSAQPPNTGITGARESAAAQATAQDQANFDRKSKDWRVRLALAPGANYLYKAAGNSNGQIGTDILYPLYESDGVIFPYTPSITVQYSANYNPQDITHSNYKIYQYQNSSVDTVNISGTFTCQDVFEAKYLLAVIHFFRSMTKMFYGQDDNPKNGTPPPLCYIYGLGGYQFDALPLAITGFTYNLPTDVDYIPTTGASLAGTIQPTLPNNNTNGSANFLSGAARLLGVGIGPGGTPRPPSYPSTPASINEETTWVPTRIELQINCAPVMSRNMVSNNFSLKKYGTGDLLRGSKNPGGGMW